MVISAPLSAEVTLGHKIHQDFARVEITVVGGELGCLHLHAAIVDTILGRRRKRGENGQQEPVSKEKIEVFVTSEPDISSATVEGVAGVKYPFVIRPKLTFSQGADSSPTELSRSEADRFEDYVEHIVSLLARDENLSARGLREINTQISRQNNRKTTVTLRQ